MQRAKSGSEVHRRMRRTSNDASQGDSPFLSHTVAPEYHCVLQGFGGHSICDDTSQNVMVAADY